MSKSHHYIGRKKPLTAKSIGIRIEDGTEFFIDMDYDYAVEHYLKDRHVLQICVKPEKEWITASVPAERVVSIRKLTKQELTILHFLEKND